jgi:dienelactone hydrolase
MKAAAFASLVAVLVGACTATTTSTSSTAEPSAMTSATPTTAWPPQHATIERRDTTLSDPADGREVPLRIVYPASGSRLPVVLFSHGAFSSGRDYDPLLDAWAARGYVVFSPTHRDSISLGTKRGGGDPRHFPWRLDDMALLLRDLDRALDTVPGLAPRTDRQRLAATGHSFGGLVAQTLGGATFFDPASGQAVSRAEPRVRAVIVFSGAGTFPPILRNEDFAALKRPTLVTVGSDDLPQAPGLTGYAWRRQPWDLAAPGDKYLLTLDGADHYLGGTVGRDDLPRAARGPEYVAAFQQVSSAFLDAFIRGDGTATRWLATHATALEAPAAAGLPPAAHLARR